jgi:hypothetical protein
VGVAAVIMACAMVVALTAIGSFFLAPPMPSDGAPPETYQPTDPVTVATQSVRLTAPVPLRVSTPFEGVPPIDYGASPRGAASVLQADDPEQT